MKVTFKTGSEANYGSTNGELFFASNTKQIMLNGIKYIPKKLSELTNDSGFLTSITKSMVEGVLTGNITSHTHSYLPLSGGTLTGSLTCNGSYINVSGTSGATGYRGYFNNSQSNRAAGSHIFQQKGFAYGTNATSIGLDSYAGIRNTDGDSDTYPYLHWQWMNCLQVKEVTDSGDVNCYGAILNNLGGTKNTAKFTVCVDGVCKFYDESKGENDATNKFLKFTNTDANYGRVVVFVVDTGNLIFGGTTERPRSMCNLRIGNILLGRGCYVKNIASADINGKTVYRLAIYWWSGTLPNGYDITKATTAMVCTKVNDSNYSGASSFASGNASVAKGYSSVASGYASTTSGGYSIASGAYSVASGVYSTASGQSSIASGAYSVAGGHHSMASGYSSIANGNYSVASGYYSVASGDYSIASGYSSIASGSASVASGANSVASGSASMASGYSSVASGYSSIASGSASTASGDHSIASGYSSVAKHNHSKVYATRGISGAGHQTVLGRDNVETSGAVIVGWGSSDANRKNIFVLDTNGNATFGSGGAGAVTAATFNGSLNGNATSSSKLATPRTIKVGSASKSFDGSGDIEFALNNIITQNDTINAGTLNVAEQTTTKNITIGNNLTISSGADISGLTPSMIGAAAASHTHSYLPLSGGTMTGSIYINNTVPITHKTAKTGNWIYISKLLTGSDVSDKKYEACIGWINQGGDRNASALTLIPYAQDDAPYAGRIGLYIAQNSLKFNNTAVSLDGHTHSYLPLSGGTMSNTSLVTNLNADLLDGYHAEIMVKSNIDYADDLTKLTTRAYFKTTYISGQGDFCSLVVPTWGRNTTEKYYITELRFKIGSINPQIRTYSQDNGTSSWGSLALLTDNVASASKWANARTITLTGSVTGSVSIDGSANVSLDTALNLENKHLNAGSITVSDSISAGSISANSISCGNKDVSLDGHTHAFASLEDKPTTLSGYGITDAYTKTETNTELSKYLPLTGGTLNGVLTVPTLTATGKILLGDSSLSAMVGSIGIQRYDETGFIGFLKELNLDNSFNGVVLGWDGNYQLLTNSVRIDASTFTYKGNSVLHSGNLGYISSGLSRAVQKDTNGNLFIVAPSLFEQGISDNYPKNLRWSNETEGQLVYDTEETAGSTTTVEVSIPVANGTSKGFLKSTSEVTNVTGYNPCPVVSGTPYYKEDCLYLGSTEIGYTGIMEYGIQYTYNYGTKLPYLEDYTPDSIPRCVVLCFPDRSSNYRFLFWLSAFDEGDPYIARFYNSAYETWLTIDTASRQIILSYGDTWQS